jgi:hypothetical protein
MGRFDSDCVRAGLRGLSHDDGQPHGRWERRERFPIDIFGQDRFENLLPELVGPDFVLLNTLYGTGFLRHTNLLRAGNVKHHGSQLFAAAQLDDMLDLRGQGGEIAPAAVIANNDEPI